MWSQTIAKGSTLWDVSLFLHPPDGKTEAPASGCRGDLRTQARAHGLGLWLCHMAKIPCVRLALPEAPQALTLAVLGGQPWLDTFWRSQPTQKSYGQGPWTWNRNGLKCLRDHLHAALGCPEKLEHKQGPSAILHISPLGEPKLPLNSGPREVVAHQSNRCDIHIVNLQDLL